MRIVCVSGCCLHHSKRRILTAVPANDNMKSGARRTVESRRILENDGEVLPSRSAARLSFDNSVLLSATCELRNDL